MSERTIRAALNAAAGAWCQQTPPCFYCRGIARDIVLTFLAEIPGQLTPMPPVEMRLMVARDGADA